MSDHDHLTDEQWDRLMEHVRKFVKALEWFGAQPSTETVVTVAVDFAVTAGYLVVPDETEDAT